MGGSLFPDVFFPDFGMLAYIFREQIDTFAGVEVNDFDAILEQPIDSALKVHGLANDDRPDAKLPDQTAAIPARSQRRYHDFVAVGSLAPRAAKRVGFPVRGGIAFLHPAIVTFAQKRPFACKKSGADGNSSFYQSGASFLQSGLQHRLVLFSVFGCVRRHFNHLLDRLLGFYPSDARSLSVAAGKARRNTK